MKVTRSILLLLIIFLIAAFFILDLQQYMTLDALKSKQHAIEAYRNTYPGSTVIIYALVYIVMTGLSLPGATILTLAGGAIFGLLWGTVIVSFASTIGALLAFLAARFLFRDAVKSRFGSRMQVINDGIDRDGAFYLFTLRLVPFFPFFMINLTMGLTTLKVKTFYWVSQLGMLAGTIIYVNAGTQLAKIESLSDILSPALIASFILLGFFPMIAKKILSLIQAKKYIKIGLNPKFLIIILSSLVLVQVGWSPHILPRQLKLK